MRGSCGTALGSIAALAVGWVCTVDAIAGDRRDIVFDCPCSAEWVAGEPGEPGTLTLHGGIRSHRATASGNLQLSTEPWSADGASVESLERHERVRGDWTLAFEEPAPRVPIEVYLLEQTGRKPDGEAQWHHHEALAMWPVREVEDGGEDTGATGRFVDILTDTDGDGVGDVNERLAGMSWDDPLSTPRDSVIDLLALYTAEFRDAEAGYPYTRLLHVANVASAVLEDNGTNIRLRLVGTSEVALDEDGWARGERRRELMDGHGADMSVQLGPNGPCGSPCANVGAQRSSRWLDAQAWVGWGSAYATLHELGHAMGLAHSARQGETYGAWRWSRGHYVSPRSTAEAVGTIMSYAVLRLEDVFSNPLTECGGGACGVHAGDMDGADAVSSLDILRFQIAAHRRQAPDSDGDGFVDAADALPDDPGDWFDADGDGVGDNADPDDDNDGTDDAEDAFPLDPEEWADADGDGIGDNADDDVRDLSPFRDPALRVAVESALGKEAGAAITAEDMASLTNLSAWYRDIRDLTGLELATALENLSLHGNLIADVSPLAELTSLRALVLSSNLVADVGPLSELSGLERLTLSQNPVADVSPLAGLDGCRFLKLSDTRVDFADVVELPYFDHLQGLGISGLGVQSISVLAGLRLRELDLARNPVRDLSPLSGLTALWRLDLSDTGLVDVGALAEVPNLQLLDLSDNRIVDVSPLADVTGLRYLYLRNNNVVDIAQLAGLPNLRSLDLGRNRITEISPLSGLTQLTVLDLRDNLVSDVAPLAGMVEMEYLMLSRNRIVDLSALAGMTMLRRLELGDNRVVDVAPLAGALDLTWLGLTGNSISDISPLSVLTGMEVLGLRANHVEDIEPLADMVRLRWLSLDRNRVADIAPLSSMRALHQLYLDHNAVSDIGPLVDRAIFGGSASAGRFVGLNGNPLNDASVQQHIPLLSSWGIQVRFSVREIAFGRSAIVDPTLRALLADELAGGELQVDHEASGWPAGGLVVLRLHGQGVASLAGLEAAKRLRTLHAASNGISDLSPLAELADLAGLDLRDNRIADIGPLVGNAGLGEGDWLALDGNPLSEESLNTHVPALLERGVQVGVGTIELALAAGDPAVQYDTSGYFDAVLGEGTTISAVSDDATLATAEVVGGVLVVTPGETAGTLTVRVEGDDRAGAVETLEFAVIVRGVRLVPLFPGASGDRQGFVRVVNRDRAGEVRIQPVDDAGTRAPPLTLAIGAGEAVHFNSADLENGNPGKGLAGGSGPGTGDWRLELTSALDIEALAYVRTPDGFLTAMHDVAPATETGHRVPVFNPASNVDQVSVLRLVNLGDEVAEATISGVDDFGETPGDDVLVEVPAGGAVTVTAAELEAGGGGLRGALGDGRGKWRLQVASEGELAVMNLMESPEGHLTNLSTVAPPALVDDGVHTVPLFPSASDPAGRQGFVRVINRSDIEGIVHIRAFDDSGRRYEPLELALGAARTAHFNSNDLDLGNEQKGVSGSTGSGTGDWRLEIWTELDIEVLAYVRTASGFLTSMHDVAAQTGRRYDAATFNPGSNIDQASRLRIVNPGSRPAHVSVAGVDDAGEYGADVARLTIPAGAGHVLTAAQLESGQGFRGWIGDGKGKWRLTVDSERPVLIMNLLESPTGHLTNLSTSPGTEQL